MTDRLIRITTALAVAAVTVVAALALVGSFELLMMLIRTGRGTWLGEAECELPYQAVPPLAKEAPPELTAAPTLDQTVRTRHEASHSQRAIARELNIDRRKIKRILDRATYHSSGRPRGSSPDVLA